MTPLAWIATAGAAFTPEGATEVWLESGYVLDQPAVGFGGGHHWRVGAASFGASAAVGARAPLDDFPTDSPYALGTLWAGVGKPEIGFVAIADLALLGAEEEDCKPGAGCRHTLWVGNQTGGIALQPAGGLVFGGQGASGGRWSFVLGLQPHVRYNVDLYLCPRVDFVAAVSKRTTMHMWGSRYGIAIGVGQVLGRRRGASE